MSESRIAKPSDASAPLDKPHIVVREATDADRKAIEYVLLDAYAQYEAVLGEERWQAYKDNILQAIDEAVTMKRFVAVYYGELVGSVFMFANAKTAYGQPELEIESPIIRLLAVTRQARGLGVATALIRASAQWAKASGAATLHLHTSDLMSDAIRLYEYLGFERAYDKEFFNGNILVKSYRLQLSEASFL